MVKLPIHYLRRTNVVGHAQVDDDLAPLLSEVFFYIANRDRPRFHPPRTTLLSKSSGTITLYLHRAVVVVATTPPDELVPPLTFVNPQLRKRLASLGRIYFKDGDPWNCQLANLSYVSPPTFEQLTAKPPALPKPDLGDMDGLHEVF